MFPRTTTGNAVADTSGHGRLVATERIRRALELARAERAGRNTHVAPLIETRTLAHKTTDATERAADIAPEPLGHHVQTRVHTLSPEMLRNSRLVQPNTDAAALESFALLRTQLLQRLRPRGMNSIGVVSAASGDGKSTVALNLAVAIARDASTNALLVDLDLRNPSLGRMLGLDISCGVENVLAGTHNLEAALVRLENHERLLLLPALDSFLQSSELLAAPAARALASELKSRYADRVVLYDLPPLLGSDDSLAFLPNVDAVLLIVAEGRTRTEHLQRTLELLKDKPIVGTVLNHSRDAPYQYSSRYHRERVSSV